MKRVDLRDSEVDGHFLSGEREDRWVKELLALVRVLRLLKQCRHQEGGCGEFWMTRWRKSTGEGSIYMTKRAGVILTYLFTVFVKFEDVQVDMVNVRTIIKGLCRWLDSKRSWFLEISYCARSPGLFIGRFFLTEILPMNVYLGGSVQKVERFKVYARGSG